MILEKQNEGFAPDFFLIGAARSGTSALTQLLEQHPDVFISDPKEPHHFAFPQTETDFRGPGDSYFNRSVVADDRRYEQLYRSVRTNQVTGDASASYLYYTDSLKRINEANPNAKIVCLLRQPVDRAYSAYMYLRSRLLEPNECFRSAVDQEADRIRDNWHHLWHYRQMSHYRSQVEAVLSTFAPEQILLLTYDEFRESPQMVVSRCFSFLEVDSDFTPGRTPESLVSGAPRSKVLQSVLQSDFLKSCLRPIMPATLRNKIQSQTTRMNIRREPLAAAVRDSLRPQFVDDIQYIEQVVDQTLQW